MHLRSRKARTSSTTESMHSLGIMPERAEIQTRVVFDNRVTTIKVVGDEMVVGSDIWALMATLSQTHFARNQANTGFSPSPCTL